ncbi:hypothetical protein DPMN_039833 [Dreissena polymorpha]|uniref:Uncharacterized protein n=1 Tax=Dreissena polymorpha TaxID=45954 RepID=A0A9D4HW99_DREPO|nr:hypothetical protein DPMN_039833 [Dreissena polymorpha]
MRGECLSSHHAPNSGSSLQTFVKLNQYCKLRRHPVADNVFYCGLGRLKGSFLLPPLE